jgi:hypothetical protein
MSSGESHRRSTPRRQNTGEGQRNPRSARHERHKMQGHVRRQRRQVFVLGGSPDMATSSLLTVALRCSLLGECRPDAM